MSYVKPTKNGYYGYAYYRDKNGKRRQKSVGKFKFKRDALKEADKVEKELDTVNINLKDISFADYYNRWYETYKGNSSLADITKKRYLIFYKVIQNYFKNKKLRDVKRIEYQQFINWYGKDHAWKSVSKLNGAIRQCVSYAIDDDIIAKDFTHNVQLTHNKEKELKVEYLNNDEIKVLKKATIEGLNKNNTRTIQVAT